MAARITATQILIYLMAFGIVLLLLGLVTFPRATGDNPFPVENFDESSEEAIEGGASALYGWGYKPIVEKTRKKKHRIHCPQCDTVYIDYASDDTCRNCDITLNKDIDKYVLKSSVPPCPNMDNYAKKSELPPWFNPDEWVRKSDIPPCPPPPNMEDYIRKADVPPCPLNKECPKCPVCPECPRCPPCPPPEVKIVEKVRVEKAERPGYLPQSWGSYYPQTSGSWRPRLSNTSSGFIPPSVPLASNLAISRGRDEILPTG